MVLADAALLERSLDNVIRNALRYSPSGTSVVIDVGRVGDRVDVRVVDRGPGVLAGDRIEVNLTDGTASVQGGVRTVLQPGAN